VAIANQYGHQGIRYFAKLIDRKYGDHVPNTHHCMNTCCEGQGTRVFGSLPEYIYSIAEEGIYVNLYAASEINCTIRNQTMKLTLNTLFPYDPKVEIVVGNDKPVKGSIRIRIPSWATKPVPVIVNGSAAGSGVPGSYLKLDRVWKNGDVISFVLPMEFRVTKYTGLEKGFEENHFALEYGPVLMAMVGVKAKKSDIGAKASPANIASLLRPVTGKLLHFTIDGDSEFEYWPYFEVQEEPFSCFPEFFR